MCSEIYLQASDKHSAKWTAISDASRSTHVTGMALLYPAKVLKFAL